LYLEVTRGGRGSSEAVQVRESVPCHGGLVLSRWTAKISQPLGQMESTTCCPALHDPKKSNFFLCAPNRSTVWHTHSCPAQAKQSLDETIELYLPVILFFSLLPFLLKKNESVRRLNPGFWCTAFFGPEEAQGDVPPSSGGSFPVSLASILNLVVPQYSGCMPDIVRTREEPWLPQTRATLGVVEADI